ncbi:hypothetical protein [Streptomyces sp. MJP52]|uniref:hypothetical protein n=1 Tax=Streptomyces sp. MJP52 TaxID=2940555 RepID=UPI002474D395|nr:hypothetical protein [Streptomyces sp. MJP52]
MSHTARGILALVLSLPNDVRENVRTLSDGYPQGRRAVAKAVEELRKLGYWVTTTERDPETGLILSKVDVFEDPALTQAAPLTALPVAAEASPPLPAVPVTGQAPAGNADTSPYEAKNQEKNRENSSPTPRRKLRRRASAKEREGDPAKNETAPEELAQRAEAARILRRLETVEPRLRLDERQVQKLVPDLCRWLARGATVVEITDALATGLPTPIYSVTHLIADRLARKLPAPKRRWKTYAECGSPGCGNLLPDGRQTGTCEPCVLGAEELFTIDCTIGAVADTAHSPVPPAIPDPREHVAALKALLGTRRPAVA